MNLIRLFISFIVVTIFIYFYEWLFHTQFLKLHYEQTMQMWRTANNMQDYLAWLVAGQVLISFMFCFIFARTNLDKSASEGLFYGILVGILLSGPHLITYAVQPLPSVLIYKWMLGTIVEMGIAGCLLGMIYKSKETF